MANPRFAWGIDIGNRALKAIKLVRDGEGVRIDDFEVIEHEFVLSNAGDNRETLIQNALAAFAAAHPMKGTGAVAVGVSGQQSFARFIKLPPVEARKIPEIVRFEAIQQIPFPLDEVEWSYQLFHDEASPDVEVGIFAMRKDLVNQHIGYFTAAGIPVQAVQMNPLSVYNAMYFDQRLKGTTMIIDLGAENADLIITEGESIWLRSIPIGGNNFTEALTKAFKLRFEKAEELKRNAQTSKYGRQILQAMRPVFADLVAEIQRSIGFYSSVHRDSRIARVLALGGTFKLPGLQKYLQQNLSLEVQKVDALGQAPPAEAKVAAALNDNLLSSVGAYGLALQALGDAKINSSLLPQVIRRERMWKEKTKWFGAAAACFVAATSLAYFRQVQAETAHQNTAGDYAKLDRVFQDGKGLSDSWAEVEGRGTADRQRIQQVNSLAAYHRTWSDILKTIESSLPPAPPADVNELKKTKRDERAHLLLEGHQSTYMADVSQLVARDAGGAWAMPNGTFYTYAARPDASAQDWRNRAGPDGTQGTPQFQPPPTPFGRANPFGQPTMDSQRLNFGPGPAPAFNTPQPAPPPGQFGTPGADPNVPAVPTVPQRGFVVTLTMLTPYAKADTLVHQTVVTHLQNWEERERKKAEAAQPAASPAATPDGVTPPATPPTPATPPRAFSIPRVLIATSSKIENHEARRQMIINRAREAAARKAQVAPLWDPGDAPGQGGGGGAFPNPFGNTPNLIGGPQPAAGFPTAMPAGGVGQPGTEEDALLVDPVTGESVKGDSEVVVVAVVVIEPVPATAAAPAAAPTAVAPAAPVTPAAPGPAPAPFPMPGPAGPGGAAPGPAGPGGVR